MSNSKMAPLFPITKNGSIQFPNEYGGKFKIFCISKKIGQRLPVPLSVSSSPQKSFALFPEDDVDFEIELDNSECPNRAFWIQLEVHRKEYSFMAEASRKWSLKTLESNGRKLHFVRQSSQEGQTLVSTAAHRHDLSYQAASVMISQLKLSMTMSRRSVSNFDPSSFFVILKDLCGKTIRFNLSPTGSVRRLKKFVQEYTGASIIQQRLIHHGKTMKEGKIVGDYVQITGGIIHLTLQMRGGGSGYGRCGSAICECEERGRKLTTGQNDVGERGAICFGEKCGQQFQKGSFIPDDSIKIEPILVEMRMAGGLYSYDL